jgi:putative FmdB family regulatory protein
VPTYQYACTGCEHELEAVQKFSDDALTECPECAGRLRKVYSAVGVVFKGPGFYRNDSRAKSSSSDVGGSSAPNSGDSGGDKKPAAKSEPAAAKSDSGPTRKSTGAESAA